MSLSGCPPLLCPGHWEPEGGDLRAQRGKDHLGHGLLPASPGGLLELSRAWPQGTGN